MHLEQYISNGFNEHIAENYCKLSYVLYEDKKAIGQIIYECYLDFPLVHVRSYSQTRPHLATLRNTVYDMCIKVLRDTMGYKYCLATAPKDKVKFTKFVSKNTMTEKATFMDGTVLLVCNMEKYECQQR